MRTGKPVDGFRVWVCGIFGAERTDARNRLRHPDRRRDAEDLPEEIEQHPTLLHPQQRLPRPYKPRFADQVDDLLRDAVALQAAPPHDEKHTGEQGPRDEIQHDQDGSGHRADNGQTHEEMRHALLDYAFRDDFLRAEFGAVGRLGDLEDALVVGHAVCVDGCLRDETVWQGDVDDAGDEAGAAEEEEVPVEAAGFLQWELLRLGGDAALVLVGELVRVFELVGWGLCVRGRSRRGA